MVQGESPLWAAFYSVVVENCLMSLRLGQLPGITHFMLSSNALVGEALHDQVMALYQDHVNPYLARLMAFAGFGTEVKGEGAFITDHEGREFLDFLGGYGVFSLGHRHPKVVQAVKDQLDLMPLSGKTFFGPKQAQLAQKLAELSPEGLEYTFFCNSGTEAVEAALKFARAATGRTKFVSSIGGYHGKTMGALAVTGREKYQTPFVPLMPGAEFVPYGDIEALKSAVDGETAAVILEPLQGEGGIHLPPPGYLAEARRICDKNGALLILDEVQTGLGRTGAMFASAYEGVRPDLMPLAKALGGGVMPIGACMGTAQVWEKVFSSNPLAHTSTFGGNPLACAAGIAALEVTVEENLCEKAAVLGSRIMAGLAGIEGGLVSEVRGRGLMIGVEFSRDEVGELVIAQMVKRGLIAAYTLNNPRVIRLEPPLIITEAQADQAVGIVKEAVQETSDLLASLGV